MGNSPSHGLQEIAAAARKRVKELETYLKQFCTLPSSAAWSRPNKRLAAVGVHYAGAIRNELPKLVFAIDTSGSIATETIQNFAGILQSIFKRSEFRELHVCYFTSNIYRVDIFNRNEPFVLGKISTGGTSFQPVFDYAAKLNAKSLIVLTDGEATIPTKPSFKVCWALTQAYPSIEYGTKIQLNLC